MSNSKFLKKFYVKTLPPDQPTYKIDKDVYQRFDQRNNLTIGRPSWDEKMKAHTSKEKQTRAKRILEDKPGYHVEDYALFTAAGVVAETQGTRINQTNRGLTSWQSKAAPPDGVSRWEGSPAEAAEMIKRTAHFFGADLVGIAPLNPLWVFSHAYYYDGSHKEIVFADAEKPTETDEQLIIPNSMRWVIVMGMRMDSEIIQYAPSPVGCAGTHVIYSRMAVLISTVAQFLRGIGYNAIPSLNDLALNIPMAIDAGFGEQGRNGKLISPEFGPSVRLCKVITDLPMERDNPISFGVKEFCRTCLKCADSCPAHAISKGEPTWTGPTISNAPGQYTWHLNNDACRRYWASGPADNCTTCIRSCPFTKGSSEIHDLSRMVIANFPALNSLFRRLDDTLGYGNEKDASKFWVSKNGKP